MQKKPDKNEHRGQNIIYFIEQVQNAIVIIITPTYSQHYSDLLQFNEHTYTHITI